MILALYASIQVFVFGTYKLLDLHSQTNDLNRLVVLLAPLIGIALSQRAAFNDFCILLKSTNLSHLSLSRHTTNEHFWIQKRLEIRNHNQNLHRH